MDFCSASGRWGCLTTFSCVHGGNAERAKYPAGLPADLVLAVGEKRPTTGGDTRIEWATLLPAVFLRALRPWEANIMSRRQLKPRQTQTTGRTHNRLLVRPVR